jgi:phage shock protein PspC (stress-responsive transcriptional regulator)/predicted membrane protein
MDEEHEQVTDGAVTSEPNPPKPTRLRRSTKRRMVGGVAGGIGERFDIDANIVRVVFVVLTVLYGLGAAIYLAMWALIPRDGQPSDGDAVESGDAPPASNLRLLRYVLLAGVVVVAVIVLSTFGGAPRVGNGFGILWLIFLIVLAILSLRSSARQHLLLRFIALVFLTGMTIFILIVGAFLGFLASTGVPMHGGSGARVDQPTSLAQVQRTYETEFGNMTVDLRQVQFTPTTTSVTASVAVGVLNVDIPANAIVYLKTHIGAGTVTYFGRDGYQNQPFNAVPSSLKTAEEQRRAPHLVLNVQVGVGRITLQRGYVNNNPYR